MARNMTREQKDARKALRPTRAEKRKAAWTLANTRRLEREANGPVEKVLKPAQARKLRATLRREAAATKRYLRHIGAPTTYAIAHSSR